MVLSNHNHHVRNLPKKEEEKKKSWKERQRERQTKARARKIVFGICLIGLIFVAFAAWQFSSKPPSSTNGTTNNPTLTGSAPRFSLADINGAGFVLSQHAGDVIAVHFMAVSCGGGIVQTNENQLRTLKSVCSTYCGKKPIAIVTVAATTCAKSCLETICSNYAVTWTLGNDYDDGIGDIVSAYSSYSITDGAIVLIDRNFNIAEVYTGETTFETLSSRVSQLL